MLYRHIIGAIFAVGILAISGLLYFNILKKPKSMLDLKASPVEIIKAQETIPFDDIGSRPMHVLYIGSKSGISSNRICNEATGPTEDCRSIKSIADGRDTILDAQEKGTILFEDSYRASVIAGDWGLNTSVFKYGVDEDGDGFADKYTDENENPFKLFLGDSGTENFCPACTVSF